MIAGLNTHDVSDNHSRRLRRQCHAVLQTKPTPARPPARVTRTRFRRVIGPALAGAWCLAYLVEIVRRAAAMFGAHP